MLKKFALILISFFLIVNSGFAEELNPDIFLTDEIGDSAYGETSTENSINTSSSSNIKCEGSGCIETTDFKISVSDISPIKSSLIQDTTEQTINYTLGTIIEKLMIGLGSFAVLIMTIGAGYMILYHGEDELLSKGKYIFASGVIALVVALSSYYIVSLLRYLLYN